GDEQVDDVAQLAVHAGGVGDDPHALALEQVELAAEQDVQAGLDRRANDGRGAAGVAALRRRLAGPGHGDERGDQRDERGGGDDGAGGEGAGHVGSSSGRRAAAGGVAGGSWPSRTARTPSAARTTP